MLGSDALDLFIGGRLNEPLGYINGEGCIFAMGAGSAWQVAGRRRPGWRASGLPERAAMACLALLSRCARSRDRDCPLGTRGHRVHPRPATPRTGIGGDLGGGGRRG